ncbi:hypothetical protein [Clostridium sp. FP1]|uniref:hypothetical protein n=1 Tax=Clostridium sp. FP1 TaxID=2724076 RepID=UPI0013E99E63|nr:hypothetical protein [Clostridium sp. FP1]MBZ9634633.1 hypothetical protein [Clostridium sp. FP1]
MNYVWTIQKKSVVDISNSKGGYYPNFRYDQKKCNKAYQFVLDSFNQVNESDYAGLVFGFAKKGVAQYFENIDELYEYYMDNPLVTDAFHLWDNTYVILQLQYNEGFNKIPVDFNDFIQIMPPVWNNNAYNIISSRIKQGTYLGGYTLPSFTQIHIPFIKKENIVKVYGNFDKVNSDRTGMLTTFSFE